MAVVGPLFLLAAAVLTVTALAADRAVVGSAEGPRVVLDGNAVEGSPELQVYALIPDGGRRATES